MRTHHSSLLQVVFRKIADVKREQECQRSQVTLTIPEDHPVRKLFQRFRQQRDAQTPAETHTYLDHNCVQVEHHHHTDLNLYPPCQPPQQQEYSTLVNTTGRGGAPTQTLQVFARTEKSAHSCTQAVVESRSRPCAADQMCRGVNSPVQGAGGEGDVGGVSSGGGDRSWLKFGNTASVAPAPPAAEQEKQPQKEEDWSEGSQLTADSKNLDSGESGGMTSTGGGNCTLEVDEETSALHKTESCDSGITKSDLRIDRAGDARSPFERSPMERTPFELSPAADHEGSIKHAFVRPMSEQALLQTILHEAKLELKGDIQILSGRLSALESQVSQILRLLSIKRRLSLPQTLSTKTKVKSQDSSTANKPVTPQTDDGPF